MINVLFTSVGRRVELLEAFRRAYEHLHLDGRIIAIDVDPLAPALQRADRQYIVPPLHSPAYIRQLAEICRREQVNLVFPLIDPDIPVLAEHRAILESGGARLAVVPSAAVDIAADKWQTARFLEGLGVPTPRTWLPEAVDLARTDFPLFIKPRRGSAGKDSHRVHDPEELAFFLRRVQEPVIQEILPGPEITTDVVCGLDGELLGIASRQRLEVRSGEVTKGVTVYDKRIVDACALIARNLPAVGPVTIQCMMKDDVPHFTEINARFGGGVPLGIAAGVDSPRWLLARAARLPVEIPPVGSYTVGLYFTRCDRSFYFKSSELADLAGRTL